MLKSAVEMAAAAHAAKEEAAAFARAKLEKDTCAAAERREADAREDHAHRIFEHQALAAARAGQVGLTFSTAELSLDRLRGQGFVAEQLIRRESFEEHLAALVGIKKEQLVDVCEKVVSACPGLTRLDGDDFLHRNPVISLLETLWRRGELKEPFNEELLLAFARIQTAAKYVELETVRPKIGQALKLFAELKATEAKYQRVRWENSTIPKDADEATYVTWESADDDQGQTFTFSANKLKWLAKKWPEIAESLGCVIEDAARNGQSELTVYAWRTASAWNLSWDWPPDAWMGVDDDDGQDPELTNDSTWGGDLFCKPKLAAEELSLAGYEVTIETVAIVGVSEASPAERYFAARAGEAYALTIRWP